MEGNNVRIILTGILVTATLLFGCPEYLHQRDIWVALTYHFFHANLFHLATNVLAIWMVFRRGVRYRKTPLLLAYACAVVSWCLTSHPVVGISNIMFAYLGLKTPSFRDPWWRQSTAITFIAVTVGMAFLPNVSAVTHLGAFALGCLSAFIIRILKKIHSDYSRASYNQ